MEIQPSWSIANTLVYVIPNVHVLLSFVSDKYQSLGNHMCVCDICQINVLSLTWFAVFTAQPQLPGREAALRVSAQQTGPHKALDSWLWPTQSPVLVLNAARGFFSSVLWTECPPNSLLFINISLFPASATCSCSLWALTLQAFFCFLFPAI